MGGSQRLEALIIPLRLASKAIYNGLEEEGLGQAIGRAASYVVYEYDTVLIVGGDGIWFAANVLNATFDEVYVEVHRKGEKGYHTEHYPWDQVRMPWRHYDDQISAQTGEVEQ